ncbi:MAG: hypothetical protein M3Z75_02205 [Actinomycetota bacterium]|nr:hypothetical protein [Actinomycetota bacterium]
MHGDAPRAGIAERDRRGDSFLSRPGNLAGGQQGLTQHQPARGEHLWCRRQQDERRRQHAELLLDLFVDPADQALRRARANR